MRALQQTEAKTEEGMKIKDLKTGLGGIRFRYPGDGQLYYWHSQWQKGVWGKKSMAENKAYPLFVADLKDALEWDVVPKKK